jgi:pyruvate kinase
MIEKLLRAGADAFRVNMSHGDHETHAATIAAIRAVEKELAARSRCCATCKGPKLRVGMFKDGRAVIRHGATSRSTAIPRPAMKPGSACPTPNCSACFNKGQRLLIDDGKLRLRVIRARKTTRSCARPRSAGSFPTARG